MRVSVSVAHIPAALVFLESITHAVAASLGRRGGPSLSVFTAGFERGGGTWTVCPPEQVCSHPLLCAGGLCICPTEHPAPGEGLQVGYRQLRS